MQEDVCDRAECTEPMSKDQYEKREAIKREMEMSRMVNNQSWSEAGIEVKVEKLKREIQDLRYAVQSFQHLQSQVYALQNHSHSANGIVVVPLNTGGLGMAVGGMVGTTLSKRNDRLD